MDRFSGLLALQGASGLGSLGLSERFQEPGGRARHWRTRLELAGPLKESALAGWLSHLAWLGRLLAWRQSGFAQNDCRPR